MSKLLTPCLYKGSALENQWINGIHNMHDLFCGCNDTIKHLATCLKRNNSQLCLPSTADVGTQEPDTAGEDAFDEGDLDKLFEEDFDDDTG